MERYEKGLRAHCAKLHRKGLTGKIKVLLLDLDEMLVSTSYQMSQLTSLRREHRAQMLDLYDRILVLDFYDGEGLMYERMWSVVRPHAREFLREAFELCDIVAVWSAGMREYVDRVVLGLFDDAGLPHPHFVWARENCHDNNGDLIKPVDKILGSDGYPFLADYVNPDHIVLIDDKESNFDFNPERGLLIPPYRPNYSISSLVEDDRMLPSALEYIKRRIQTWRL